MTDYWNMFNDHVKKWSPKNPAELNQLLGGWFGGAADYLRERTHGGSRAILDNLPLTGKVRQWRFNVEKAEDRYNNTGIDEAYNSPYNAGLPFVNDAVGAVAKPSRMARSLMSMYGAEVQLDIQYARGFAALESRRAAQSWQQYERMRQNRK